MLLCPYHHNLIVTFLLPPSLLPVATLSFLHSHRHALITIFSSHCHCSPITALLSLLSHHCSLITALSSLLSCCYALVAAISSLFTCCCALMTMIFFLHSFCCPHCTPIAVFSLPHS